MGDQNGQIDIGTYKFGGAPFTMSGSASKRAKAFKFRDISDGLSNTLMASEVVQGQQDEPGVHRDIRGHVWSGQAAGFSSYLTPNSGLPDRMQEYYYCGTLANSPPCATYSTSEPMMVGARSRHPGGVQTALCDGSIQFISDDIEQFVWRALSTSQGGEQIDKTETF